MIHLEHIEFVLLFVCVFTLVGGVYVYQILMMNLQDN